MMKIKESLFVFASILMAMFAIACSKEDPDKVIDSLSGVWEGPMTHSDNDIHVKILNIEGTVAKLYDMKYTFDGYEVCDEQESTVKVVKHRKNEPGQFQLSIDGRECIFFIEDKDLIGDAEGECLFKLTGNTMDHYRNGLTIVPGLLPRDKEYIGPETSGTTGQLMRTPSLSLDWTDLLLWVGEAAVKSASGMAASAFLDYIFSDDSASASLDDILSHIEEIKDILNNMITLYHNSVYESKLNERSKLQYEMHNHNYEAFIRLKNATTTEQANDAITSWASKSVGGNPAYEQVLNYMDFLITTVIEQKDIFNMYDLYTYNTTPWEHQGYASREALRKSDIATAAEGLFLTQYYHMVRTDLDEKSRAEILNKNADKFKGFCEFVEKHPVMHHDNLAICQIAGAHLVMDCQAISYPDLRNPSWCNIPTRWTRYSSDEYFMWGPDQAENYNQALKPDELMAMMKYYAGKKNVYEILHDEAGCALTSFANPASGSGKRAAIYLQSGYFSADWRYIGIDRAALTSAVYPADIAPLAAGRAIIDGAGIFAQYLKFYEWAEFYDDLIWIRTKVIER